MNTYIGTKIIRAKPMTHQQFQRERSAVVAPESDDPPVEGYLVEYADGYVSWSPKAQFDEAYVLVGDIEGNCLAPHEIRVLAEQAEQANRTAKLKALIGTGAFQKLSEEDQSLLVSQLEWMYGYLRVLGARVERFIAKADDFELPAKACDLSGEGTCEACQ